MMNAVLKITARKIRIFAPISRHSDKYLPVQDACDFNLKISEEDGLIVENQKT